MASQTVENYLKAMLHLSSGYEPVSVSSISTHLEVSKPSAISMMKNLRDQGLVDYKKYKPLSLTEKGKKSAGLILRKHRLTEMFLVEKMGFDWSEVHEIAEQMEHISSPSLFERMDELLDFPTRDPHGSPIPNKEGTIKLSNLIRLSDCHKGDNVKVIAIGISSTEFLGYLDTKRISLGKILTVKSVEPFDHTITIIIDDHDELLSDKASAGLMVEKVL